MPPAPPFLKSAVSYSPEGSKKDDQIGMIAETSTIMGIDPGIRTFLVTDKSTDNISNGVFQYGLEIDIEDGTVALLNERIKRLKIIRKMLSEYSKIINMPTPQQMSRAKKLFYLF